jgi:hypothetical protein
MQLLIIFLSSAMTLAAQAETPEADLLAGSELSYQRSGGIAGSIETAKLVARSGVVTAEYASKSGRTRIEPQTAPVPAARYVELFQEAERAGIWSLEAPRKDGGADQIQYQLSAVAGGRRQLVSWTDGTSSSPSVANAVRIGERILALARELTTER